MSQLDVNMLTHSVQLGEGSALLAQGVCPPGKADPSAKADLPCQGRSPKEYDSQWAGGTHPTGMHTCFVYATECVILIRSERHSNALLSLKDFHVVGQPHST